MTARDIRVFEFLTEFKIGSTSSLCALFFDDKLRVTQYRLKAMEKAGLIKHIYEKEYLYYTKLPKQYLHAITLTNYIAWLSKLYKLGDEMYSSYKCGNLIADGLIWIDDEPTFIEIQLSNPPDTAKYLELKASKEWEKKFKKFPNIRILTNSQAINKYGLNIVVDCPKKYSLAIR